ncbi:hypothetical protein CRQ34_22185 [Salmonella enterica subsp. enterica serovar Livingstone]|nr:hypothetical protein [Salmonella enterica subsp. enterica serovar Livingstone]
MIEELGCEEQIHELAVNAVLSHESALYRKSMDADGNEYLVILNDRGEEFAEWDDKASRWIYLDPVRPTGDTRNTTDLLPEFERFVELYESQVNNLKTNRDANGE